MLRVKVQELLSLFPDELPNRTDIDQRMLNTNSPQAINDDPPPASSTKTGPTATTSRSRTPTCSSGRRLPARQDPESGHDHAQPHRDHHLHAQPSADSTLNLSAQFQRIGSLLVQPGDG
ncbi:MAG: hypothetical protein R2724_11385 [Bryobacterales bacterium]